MDISVPQAKFPNAPPDKVEKLKTILKREILKWDANISLDRLLTMLDLVEKEKAATENFKTTPPKIAFVTHPAVLVTIEGEPKLSKIENLKLMRVINTAFFIVLDTETNAYYLKGGDKWLTANNIMGPWQSSTKVPAAVVEAAMKASQAGQPDEEDPAQGQMPQIIVTTEPMELIVTDGEPEYSSIYGTNLLYVSNTESDVFMEIGSQNYFVLLSGRWYWADTLDGKWSYVPSDDLPPDFAKIPPGSTKDYVLANVAGTTEARESVLETYVPQTATVKRSEAKVVVTYDGAPKFIQIEGSDLFYATNTSYSVIRFGRKFYCCNDGVWFEAYNSMGPWEICVAVPQAIYTIPPNCPIYNVKYVYVYSSTPEVVYVGYTPGYVGCYVYGGTVVYGTGYLYHPWYGTVYYSRPATWGFGVRYNPRTGNWGFRLGYSSGGWFIGIGGFRGGRWGPRGRRSVDVNVNRSRNNLYNRRGDVARTQPASRHNKTWIWRAWSGWTGRDTSGRRKQTWRWKPCRSQAGNHPRASQQCLCRS